MTYFTCLTIDDWFSMNLNGIISKCFYLADSYKTKTKLRTFAQFVYFFNVNGSHLRVIKSIRHGFLSSCAPYLKLKWCISTSVSPVRLVDKEHLTRTTAAPLHQLAAGAWTFPSVFERPRTKRERNSNTSHIPRHFATNTTYILGRTTNHIYNQWWRSYFLNYELFTLVLWCEFCVNIFFVCFYLFFWLLMVSCVVYSVKPWFLGNYPVDLEGSYLSLSPSGPFNLFLEI